MDDYYSTFNCDSPNGRFLRRVDTKFRLYTMTVFQPSQMSVTASSVDETQITGFDAKVRVYRAGRNGLNCSTYRHTRSHLQTHAEPRRSNSSLS